jgi:hypothetical protein
MAAREGFHRIYLIGKAILAFGILLDLFLFIGFVAAAFGARLEMFGIGMLGIPATLLGIAILAATWVAEGFVNGRHSARPRKPHSPNPVR